MKNFIKLDNDSNLAVELLHFEYEKVFDDLYDNFDIDLLFESNDNVIDISKVGEYLFIFFILSLSNIYSKAYAEYLKSRVLTCWAPSS